MKRSIFVSLLVVLCVFAPIQAGSGPAVGKRSARAAGAAGDTAPWPTRRWRRSKPKRQGLDGRALSRLVERIRRGDAGNLHSLLVVRNGYLVVEEYFGGWDESRVHTLQSDSKSVTSLLVGIAVNQGAIESVDEPVVGFFPEYERIRNLDERKAAMRVQDLLTMRTGLDWSEARYEGSPLQQLNESREDWLKLVLDWPMLEQPGTRFEYNSGGVILLAGIIGNATGLRADAFADRYLFAPLGIEHALWNRGYPNGLPHTGGGLWLRPQDMAKIGYLVLRGGMWDGQRIVSEEWLASSTSHTVRNPRTFRFHPTDYGYLWWLMPHEGGDVITAAGARDQWIFVVPAYDMVVVVTGETEDRDFGRPVDFLYSDILAAVRDE